MGRWGFSFGGLVVASVIFSPVAATAQRPRFDVGPPIPILVGTAGVQAIALGDFNKDGLNDVVVVSPDEPAGSVARLNNHGGGAFGAPRFFADADLSPVALAVADVGSVTGGLDQSLDIIVVDRGRGFFTLFGDGGGSFTATSVDEIDGLDAPVGVAVADFDGRNGPDLAFIDAQGTGGNGEIFFLCNTSEGGLEPCISARFDSDGANPVDVAAGDFNGDGRMDAVVLNQGVGGSNGNVSLYIGQGDGRFSRPSGGTFLVTDVPQDLVVGDLNSAEDDIDDVAVGTYELLSNDNVLVLLGGTSNRVFRTSKALLELATTAIAAGKFTNDDNADLVGGNDPTQISSIISIAVGDGTGAFQDPQIGRLLPGGARALASGRLDGDDLDDLVALNQAGTELRIAFNTFDAATPTSTATSTQVPTRTGTATPLASPTSTAESTSTITSTPITANTSTPIAREDDDACQIGAGGARGSWLPPLVGIAAILLRRRCRP